MKDKIEYLKVGNDVVKRTTTYTVNPETGDIVPNPNDEITASIPSDSPVHDFAEYKSVISSNGLDSEGHVIESPIVTIPEFIDNIEGRNLVDEKSSFDLKTFDKIPFSIESNDFVSKKDFTLNKPVIDMKTSFDNSDNVDFRGTEMSRSEKSFSKLPNTASQDSLSMNILGGLTLTSVLGLVATKRNFEE